MLMRQKGKYVLYHFFQLNPVTIFVNISLIILVNISIMYNVDIMYINIETYRKRIGQKNILHIFKRTDELWQ